MKEFVTESKIYSPSEITDVLECAVDEDMLVSTGKRTPETKLMIRCYNLPSAFDIETTSLYLDGDIKSAPMYVWQFGINGYVVIGRTWDEFENMLQAIIKKLDLAEDKRLVIYVHNLSFEFHLFSERSGDKTHIASMISIAVALICERCPCIQILHVIF